MAESFEVWFGLRGFLVVAGIKVVKNWKLKARRWLSAFSFQCCKKNIKLLVEFWYRNH